MRNDGNLLEDVGGQLAILFYLKDIFSFLLTLASALRSSWGLFRSDCDGKRLQLDDAATRGYHPSKYKKKKKKKKKEVRIQAPLQHV